LRDLNLRELGTTSLLKGARSCGGSAGVCRRRKTRVSCCGWSDLTCAVV